MHQGEGGCCPPENVPLDVDVVLGQVDADLHVVGAALLRGVCVDVQQVDLRRDNGGDCRDFMESNHSQIRDSERQYILCQLQTLHFTLECKQKHILWLWIFIYARNRRK